MSYTIAENNLSTAVSKFPSYVSMNRSVISVSKGAGDKDSAYKSDINISTD